MQDLDAALIRELRRDGRAGIQKLADRTGAPRGTVSVRLRRLLAEQRVRIIAAADPTLLGQHVIAHVSLVVAGPIGPTVADLVARPEAVFVSAAGGTHAVVAEVRVGTTRELHELLGEIRTGPEVVAIDTLVYAEVLRGSFVARSPNRSALDALDRQLIGLLQADARAGFRDLGRAIRLSPSATATRVRKLIDNGVLTISAIQARTSQGRNLALGVGLNLAGPGGDVLAAVREPATIDFAATTVGRFDLVATLVAPTSEALRDALEEIRALQGVRRTTTWLHLDVVKEDYVRRGRAPG